MTSNILRVLHYDGVTGTLCGVETFILQLCAAQKRAGLVPSVVLDLEGRDKFSDMAGKLGIPVHPLPHREGVELKLPRKFSEWFLRFRRIKRLVRLLREADVLHIHEGVHAFDAFVAARLAGIKAVIVTHHGSLSYHKASWRPLQSLTFWLEKRWASEIAVPYRAAALEYIGAGVPESRTKIVPFCADEMLFTGVAKAPEPEHLILVILSRLVEGKGHTELLSAIAQLAPRYPGLRLLIIGDGPMRSALEIKTRQLELSRIVEFLGDVEHQAVPATLERAHVIVLPSYMSGETFPLCLIEGMALGLPAIGAQWFGIPDIIADGHTGIIVGPGDVRSLRQAIERFLTDRAFYMHARQNAVARFHAHFTSTAVVASYLSSYRTALTT